MGNLDKQSWITTFTGRRFHPLNPKAEDINIDDIAHSLSNQCRFLGHCTQFYSVCQHSVLVSLMCPIEDALWGLLHDSSESFLVDVPSPLKKLDEFSAYRDAEVRLMNLICDVFGLSHIEPESVKIADKRMLATEARDLTVSAGLGWTTAYDPYEFSIKAWTPEYARIKFLARFHELIKLPLQQISKI